MVCSDLSTEIFQTLSCPIIGIAWIIAKRTTNDIVGCSKYLIADNKCKIEQLSFEPGQNIGMRHLVYASKPMEIAVCSRQCQTGPTLSNFSEPVVVIHQKDTDLYILEDVFLYDKIQCCSKIECLSLLRNERAITEKFPVHAWRKQSAAASRAGECFFMHIKY